MKITIEKPKLGEEDEIIVRVASPDEKLMQWLAALTMERQELTGYAGDKIMKLALRDIFYIEAVDNRVFAYTDHTVCELHRRLYEIEEAYAYTDFLRISKSMIVNISKIAYIRPLLNSRFEAKLKNGEKIVISRKYALELKRKLGI